MKTFLVIALFTCLYATRFQELAMSEAKVRAPLPRAPQSLLDKRPNLEQQNMQLIQSQNQELPDAQSMINLQFLQDVSIQELVELQTQKQDIFIQLPLAVSLEGTQMIQTNADQALIELPKPVQMENFIQLPMAIRMQNMQFAQTDSQQNLIELPKPMNIEKLIFKHKNCLECSKLESKEKEEAGNGMSLKKRHLQ